MIRYLIRHSKDDDTLRGGWNDSKLTDERISQVKNDSERRKNIIIVTHGGVINVIYSLIDGAVFSNKNKAERILHAVLLPVSYTGKTWIR